MLARDVKLKLFGAYLNTISRVNWKSISKLLSHKQEIDWEREKVVIMSIISKRLVLIDPKYRMSTPTTRFSVHHDRSLSSSSSPARGVGTPSSSLISSNSALTAASPFGVNFDSPVSMSLAKCTGSNLQAKKKRSNQTISENTLLM